jgi:hypothetical protein
MAQAAQNLRVSEACLRQWRSTKTSAAAVEGLPPRRMRQDAPACNR